MSAFDSSRACHTTAFTAFSPHAIWPFFRQCHQRTSAAPFPGSTVLIDEKGGGGGTHTSRRLPYF